MSDIEDMLTDNLKVYSIWKCAFCKPIQERSHEAAVLQAESMGWDIEKNEVAGWYMNPPACPYNYVKIDGRNSSPHRSTSVISDTFTDAYR